MNLFSLGRLWQQTKCNKQNLNHILADILKPYLNNKLPRHTEAKLSTLLFIDFVCIDLHDLEVAIQHCTKNPFPRFN